MGERKVNLFLIGGMRSGTTSLFHYFSGHEDIFGLPVKEPHFFTEPWPEAYHPSSSPEEIQRYLDQKTRKAKHILKIDSTEHYERLTEGVGSQKYVLEASTSYFHGPDVANRIHRYNPEAKIIVLLRDPLQRSYSHFAMNKALGKEDRNWEEVMEEELSAHSRNALSWHCYLGMSFYDAATARYKDLFKDVFVLSLEALKDHPEKTLKELSDFLEISFDPNRTFPKHNEGRNFFYQPGYNYLKRSGAKSFIARIIPSSIRRSVYKLFSSQREDHAVSLTDPLTVRLQGVFKQESSGYYIGRS